MENGVNINMRRGKVPIESQHFFKHEKEERRRKKKLFDINKLIQKDIIQNQPPRQFSKISVLIFQEQPFYNFPGGSICSSNRHDFSRRVHLFVEQT